MRQSEGGLTARPEVLEGPFNTRQLLRLDEALRMADKSTGLTFSLYVGELDEPVREHAEKLHGKMPDPAPVGAARRLAQPAGAGDRHRGRGAQRLPDRACKLAALSMSAAFSGGDLAGGIIAGLAQLADHAGKAPEQ